MPAFTPQRHSVTALWPVLTSRSAEGRRLSWPRRLVVCPPDDGHPSSTSRWCGHRIRDHRVASPMP